MSSKRKLTERELAKTSGYSAGEVHRRRARGEKDADIIAAAQRKREKTAGAKRPGETFAAAQARKESALADIRQTEARRQRNELVELASVNAWVAGMIVRARDLLLRLPDQLQDRIAQESDPVACGRLMRAEVEHALNDLATFEPDARRRG